MEDTRDLDALRSTVERTQRLIDGRDPPGWTVPAEKADLRELVRVARESIRTHEACVDCPDLPTPSILEGARTLDDMIEASAPRRQKEREWKVMEVLDVYRRANVTRQEVARQVLAALAGEFKW